MENARTEAVVRTDNLVEFDTSFVLFFLSMEIGRMGSFFTLDGILMVGALAAVMTMPFLLTGGDNTGFGNWLAGRSVIAGFGVVTGIAYAAGTGTLLPEFFSFVPFMLLIIASMISVFMTFSSLLGFRR